MKKAILYIVSISTLLSLSSCFIFKRKCDCPKFHSQYTTKTKKIPA